jgi:hypothetical protein
MIYSFNFQEGKVGRQKAVRKLNEALNRDVKGRRKYAL